MPVEFPTGEHATSFLAHPIRAVDGHVEVPSGPGLGVEINEEAIRRHPYAASGAKPFVLHGTSS
jgi:galactonate dehydratase